MSEGPNTGTMRGTRRGNGMQSTRLRPTATVKYKKYEENEEEDALVRVSDRLGLPVGRSPRPWPHLDPRSTVERDAFPTCVGERPILSPR